MDEAVGQIRLHSLREVGGIAKIDPCRADRIDVPEAILAEGKEVEDLVNIARAHLEESGSVIITRVSPDHLQALKQAAFPEGTRFLWTERPRLAVVRNRERKQTGGRVGVMSAGTADVAVAEEARVTAEEMGCEVVAESDVGVAGIHRLFPSLERMMGADAVVVAAGREGTLPAIVAGLVDAPVIALPVSTGYGAGGVGQAALLSMLQSCSVLAVVNIDAGFVAGAFAAKIANRRAGKAAR
ncbi:MAG: nickel pincer cofactor biosynthesis protein LarB [Methanosarcinales archaeon]|nr:nickel pincer cofactor biosynthesis protein LarB [Methanosarcinales archaeon]